MKKLLRTLAVLAVVLFAVPCFAQQTSVVYMPLVTSPQFLNRVVFQITLETPLVQVEAVAYTPASGDTHPATPTCHTARVQLAQSVARNPAAYASIFAIHLVTTSNVTTAGALTGSLTAGTLDTPATDAALFSAVSAIWSNVAGCITNQ